MSAVRPGLEVLLDDRAALIRGARVGLLAHACSVDRALVHAADRLAARDDLRLIRLFGPEHGLYGTAQDMESVGHAAAAAPVVSLYGDSAESLYPPTGCLDDLDVLVVDLQDVGARYYTYAATAAFMAEACAAARLRMVVADRPNPIGGERVEGNRVDRGFGSFVGHFPVPQRHGLTLGELLLWLRAREGWDLDLEVVVADGWRRSAEHEDTGLPWVLPSPNMPTPDTARVYPGTCLVEGTNLSEGRGTTRPFELVGAPFLDGRVLAAALDGEAGDGVAFRPCLFRPTSGKWAGRDCGGVQIHVTDAATFRPLLAGLALVAAARRLAPDGFAWRTETYEFVSHVPAFDLLAGTDGWRLALEAGITANELARDWSESEQSWLEERRAGLLYG